MKTKKNGEKIKCIGAIYKEVEDKKGKTSEWHYYITSKEMTADELLYYARMEWSVETMYGILDINLREDYCCVEDKNVQKNLNMLRKLALNIIKQYKERTSSKKSNF